MADGGGHGRHVAECGRVVQHGRPAEGLDGGGLAAGSALEAVDRRDVELVGAVAVGDLLGRDLDLLLPCVHSDHTVDSDVDTWQEVAVVGEGAGGAGVTEHRARHREVCGAAATALGALAFRTAKKKSNQQHVQRKKQPWLLHGVVLHLPTELV